MQSCPSRSTFRKRYYARSGFVQSYTDLIVLLDDDLFGREARRMRRTGTACEHQLPSPPFIKRSLVELLQGISAARPFFSSFFDARMRGDAVNRAGQSQLVCGLQVMLL